MRSEKLVETKNFNKKNDGADLAEGSFADERVDLVPVEEALAVADDVVVVVVVVAVVEDLALLLVLRVLALRLLRPPLLLGVVHLQFHIGNGPPGSCKGQRKGVFFHLKKKVFHY